MDKIKDWWDQASSKDQLYVVVCGIALLLYILFIGIFKPVKGMRDSQLKSNKAQLASLERVKEMAAQLKQSNEQGTTRQGPSLDRSVQSSLSKNGLRASSMDANGNNGLRIRVENAPFDSMLAWLYDLEVSQGLIMKDISVAAGSSPGTVSVNLRILKE